MEKVMRAFALAAATTLALETAGSQAVKQNVSKPAAGPQKPFVVPTFTVDTLPNGLRFAVLENHEVPIVVVRIPVPASGPFGISYVDPAGKEGAWGMLQALLHEGTTTRTAAQIRDEIEDLGLDASDPVAPIFGAFSFNASRSTWQDGVALYGDMLMNGAIPADAFKRLQESYATGVFGRPSGPRQAQMAAMRATFGQSSPFARFPSGETVKAITRDDLLALQSSYLRPQNFLVVIGGDVTRAEARAALTKTLGTWQRGGQTFVPPTISVTAQLPQTTIYLVDAPGSNQASILGIQPVPGRDTPDGAAMQLVANALGEGTAITGRMGTAFRGERGLSYSPTISATWRPAGEPALLTETIPVASANADTAVMELVRVLRDVRSTKPITDAEFESARAYAIGRLPRALEALDQTTQTAVMTVLRDRLSPSFYNDWVKRMSALTGADVRAAAAKYIDPDHMAIAVIGDRSKIEAALRATGIPVVIVDR
jgi:zinc protease